MQLADCFETGCSGYLGIQDEEAGASAQLSLGDIRDAAQWALRPAPGAASPVYQLVNISDCPRGPHCGYGILQAESGNALMAGQKGASEPSLWVFTSEPAVSDEDDVTLPDLGDPFGDVLPIVSQ